MNEENNKILQLPDIKAWTRDLQSLPPFSHDLLQKHLITETQADNSATGAYKHKKLVRNSSSAESCSLPFKKAGIFSVTPTGRSPSISNP